MITFVSENILVDRPEKSICLVTYGGQKVHLMNPDELVLGEILSTTTDEDGNTWYTISQKSYEVTLQVVISIFTDLIEGLNVMFFDHNKKTISTRGYGDLLGCCLDGENLIIDVYNLENQIAKGSKNERLN